MHHRDFRYPADCRNDVFRVNMRPRYANFASRFPVFGVPTPRLNRRDSERPVQFGRDFLVDGRFEGGSSQCCDQQNHYDDQQQEGPCDGGGYFAATLVMC